MQNTIDFSNEKRPENARMEDVSAGDPWSEAPFYTWGETQSDKLISIAVDETIRGRFHGLRTAKEGKKSRYAIMETLSGVKFRVFTPGQLVYFLDNRCEKGDYVEITYRGKEYVEDIQEEAHQFKVERADGNTIN